jgi:methionyl-tRNA synthetase
MSEKFFLTTPIYYVNARPHIGHAYTTIVADVLARRARAQGRDTFFLTGTDEHGQKIERSAQAAGIPPQQFTDEVSASFQALWDRMGLTYDKFIRTTSEEHKRGVQKLFQVLVENNAIYLSSYTGSYCVSDEAFVDLPAGTPCPDCGRPLETVTEENYFFKLSAYQLPLLNLIESNTLLIQPETRRNEVLSFLRGPITSAGAPSASAGAPSFAPSSGAKGGVSDEVRPSSEAAPTVAYSKLGNPYVPGALQDLSISRTSFKWGIPVPGNESHVIYVWLDALANYMTALGYGSDAPEDIARFEKYWPADLHIVGKEIIRFHCVYWPAFLMAASLPLPKQVVAHGWLLFEESKMSKSRGNIVRTETILDAFGPLCPPQRPSVETNSATPSDVSQASDEFRKGTPPGVPQTPSTPLGTPRLQPWLSHGSNKTGLQPLGHALSEESPEPPAPQNPTKHHQDLFAADVLRYFLLREIPFGQDGSFSFDALITRYNADLANGYGNLVSRTLNLISQSCGGTIPVPKPFEKRSFVMEDSNPSSFFAGTPNVYTVEGPPLAEQAAVLRIVYEKAFKELLFTSQVSETTGQVMKGGVVNSVLNLVAATDGFLTQKAPWKLAKSSDAGSLGDVHETLYTAAESIRIITLLFYPILPYATSKVWAQLGLNPADLTSNIQHQTTWGLLQPGTKLGPLAPIFPRADKGLAQIMADMETPKPTEPIECVTSPNDPESANLTAAEDLSAITAQHDAQTPAADDLPVTSLASETLESADKQPEPPTFDPAAGPRTTTFSEPNPGAQVAGSSAEITERTGTPPHHQAAASGIFSHTPSDSSPQIAIDDFAKVELRVAQVVVAERIPKADKLLRLEVDLGYEKRQILSGIAEWYTPEELLGRRIVVITNLAPRKLRGLESHGMLLAASSEGGKPYLATFADSDALPLGSRLK